MDYSLTLFKSIFDNKTDKGMNFSSWDQFEKLLYSLSEKPRKGKKDAELISPATYVNGTTRANKNVVHWAGWCAIDVDDHSFSRENLENDIRNHFGDWYYVCYSTASSTYDSPKFRLVFPLKTKVANEEIKKFWYALNSAFNELGDKQTKDLSRMYYIPGEYAGAYNFIFTNDGATVDPLDFILKYPMPEKSGNTFMDNLPDEWKRQLVQHRKDQMQNIDVSWNGYADCPFFPRSLGAEYKIISNTGWYHKMYQIMVALAGNAFKKQYPITPHEISILCKELDNDTGNWYQNRPLDKEAERAIEYVFKNI